MNGQERPTTPCVRVDMSPDETRTSAAPASLHDFFYREDGRWQGGRRIEPCACGESISLYLGERLPTVMERHQASPRHQAWRARQ